MHNGPDNLQRWVVCPTRHCWPDNLKPSERFEMHMTPDDLLQGYDWLYRRLFSLPSIWRRRPESPAALPPYLAMSLLYKRSNRLWHWLIRRRLVHAVWTPLVEVTRWRHVRYRRQLAAQPPLQSGEPLSHQAPGSPVSAGV